MIYGNLPDTDPYNLGNVRTVKEWEQYTGIDFRKQTAHPRSYLGLSPIASDEEAKFKVKSKRNKDQQINQKRTSVFESMKQQLKRKIYPVFSSNKVY
jgi:hypothetical protein